MEAKHKLRTLEHNLNRLNTMVASLGNNAINSLKPGAVLTVTGAKTEMDAHQEIAAFLQSSNITDLDYFPISKNYFLLYRKPEGSVSGVA